ECGHGTGGLNPTRRRAARHPPRSWQQVGMDGRLPSRRADRRTRGCLPDAKPAGTTRRAGLSTARITMGSLRRALPRSPSSTLKDRTNPSRDQRGPNTSIHPPISAHERYGRPVRLFRLSNRSKRPLPVPFGGASWARWAAPVSSQGGGGPSFLGEIFSQRTSSDSIVDCTDAIEFFWRNKRFSDLIDCVGIA